MDVLGPLKTYIDELRMSVASRLVAETGAVFSDIGRTVGIDVLKTFRRTFQRIRGQTPGDLRAASVAAGKRTAATPRRARSGGVTSGGVTSGGTVAEDAGKDETTARLGWFEGFVSGDPASLWSEARDGFLRLGEDVWAARTTLALLHHETATRRASCEGDPGPTPRAAALASELAAALTTLAQNSDVLVVVKALQSVTSGAEGAGALNAGVIEAADVVLSRLDVNLRARRALRLVDV